MSASHQQGAHNVALHVSMFNTALPSGPAFGTMQEMSWRSVAGLIAGGRREGEKDGENIVLARFKLERNGKVRRLKANLLGRTAIALDCETHKSTGEVPPDLPHVVTRIQDAGWAAAIYTSHNHRPGAPRYRVLIPLTAEIEPTLPAVEIIADMLGLRGVLDESKVGAASVFYLPSCSPGAAEYHRCSIVDGDPIDAKWIRDKASAVLEEREREQERQRAEAMVAAEERRRARVAAGFKPIDKLIEAIRDRFDLVGELLRHGYTQLGDRFLFSGSETGVPGVHVLKGGDGVDRVFSHHSGDPLATANLPAWCRAKAIDAVDVVTILDFGGDQKRALHELAKRFGIGEQVKRGAPEEPSGFSDIPLPDNDDQQQHADTNEQSAQPHFRSGSVWPDPVDFLSAEHSAAPMLENRHIPDALWPFVADTAARMGVDPTAVALCALVSCASITSDDWAVQPKRYDTTWTENPRIWGAIVGDPSILKTPVISAATRPIDRMEAEARAKHSGEMRQWRQDEATAKQEKTVPPPQPKLDRYLVEGSTPEALSEVLRDDDESKMRAPAKKVLSRHDEMSEFFGGLDRYKAGGKGGSERGAYLRLYNGGRYTIDRIGRGSFAVPNWSACFLGGVQPGPIQRIAREAADDGLLQRFMYCVPDCQHDGLDRQPDHDAVRRYGALFPALAALQPGLAIGETYIPPVVLHADAHAHREDIDALADAMAAMPDCSLRLKAAFGKWRGLFARLCLTFHLIEAADQRARGETGQVLQVIMEATARRVAAFMREIALPHLLRADRLMFATNQTGHAQWIANYILSKRLDMITTRHIMRDGPRELRAPEARREIDGVMMSLVAVGWLEPDDASNPAKGCIAWRVNPSLHTHFAARAEAEAARRTAERERVAEAIARVRQPVGAA